jgi:hypothetical protein
MDCFATLAMTELITAALLPCHFRSPYPFAIQPLVVVHVDRHPEQLPVNSNALRHAGPD